MDMVGNVWEWTATTYQSPKLLEPPDPPLREIRGGSWFVDPMRGSCYPFDDRSAAVQNQKFMDLGFRCCRGPQLSDARPKCEADEVYRAGSCVKY